jgi:hypothetical protein
MPKKIKITRKQLNETLYLMNEEEKNAINVLVMPKGPETKEAALKRTEMETERLVGNKPINYVVTGESKIFSKTQLLEMKRNYLNNNSNKFTKKNFLKNE